MASEGFFLAALPTELLAQILSARVSDAAIRLWKCGNRVLNKRLAEGGVLNVRLKDTQVNSSSRWPRALSSFSRLVSLVIWRPHKSFDTITNIRNGLQSLPPTLEHLELHFVNAFESLYREDAIGEPTWPNVERRSADGGCYFSRIYDSDTVAMWDMNATFPNLKTLVVGGQEDLRLRFASDVDFDALPRSLTHLETQTGRVPLMVLVSKWKRFDLLPRGLLKLNMGFSELRDGHHPLFFHKTHRLTREDLSLLPPGLTDLGNVSIAGGLNINDVVSLLPNLTNISWQGAGIWPTARSLDITRAEAFENPLPQTLTRVKIYICAMVLRSQILQLPAGLKHLKCKDLLDWEALQASDLPDVLRTFHIDKNLPTQAFHMIPRSVTSLKGQVSQNLNRKKISALPPKLTRLHLNTVEGILLDADAVELLPRSIQNLIIPACSASDSPKLFIETLPPYLTSLTLHGPPTEGHWNSEHLIGLPKTLTDLSLLNAPINVDYWQFLPRSLKRLFHVHYGFGFVIVDAIGKLHLLPPNLKRLGVSHMVISGDDLQHLPRTLKRLYTSDGGPSGTLSIKNTTLQHFTQLPPPLQVFEVKFVDFANPASIDPDRLPQHLVPNSVIVFPLDRLSPFPPRRAKQPTE